MKKKTLVMVMASFCTSPIYAAAFDRKGQEAGTNPTRNSISDIANSDYRPSAALKLQLAPQFSFGFL